MENLYTDVRVNKVFSMENLYTDVCSNLQNKVGKIYLYFGVFFNKTIIPHRLVGYEMIIGSWLSFTSLIQYTKAEVGC